jgi:hypothetical protein
MPSVPSVLHQRSAHSVHGVFSSRLFDESLPVVCDSRRTLTVLVTSWKHDSALSAALQLPD